MSLARFQYEQPSRWARVLIALLSVVVVLLSAWILTPIITDQLAAAPPTEPVRIEVRSVVPRRAAPPETDLPDAGPRPTASLAAAGTHDLVILRPAERSDAAAEPEPVGAVAAPEEPAPAPAFAAAGPDVTGLTSTPQPPPLARVPWPAPALAPPAAETDAELPDDDLVPLPRKRPHLDVAVSVAIPLPRPRPDAGGGETSPPDESGMDALIQRTSRIE